MPCSSHLLGSERIVILGAGPCGLACADELQRLGHRAWTLLEAAPVAGGLAASVVDPVGFTWDLGGHVVFSHFGEFDRLLAELFTVDELLHHDRSSYVSFRERWVPYPFQQHLHFLPAEDAQACVRDLLLACQQREEELSAADFATWLQATYGSALVERFFGPYNSKIWALEPAQMTSSWVAERVAPVDADAILSALSGTAPPARRWGPNATFAFPVRGGTGEIWRRLAARLGTGLRTGARVVAVDASARTITLADGEHIGFDHLVATMRPKRIALVGPVASGKSTLAAAIAAHTGLPHLDLDDLFWGPDWTPVDQQVFHTHVRDALAEDTWIADGNYGGEVGEILLDRAELAIWLDLPLRICLQRLIRRSVWRASNRQELFAANRETFRHLLARDSILWWGPAHHHRHRRRWAERLHPERAGALPVLHLDQPAVIVPRLRALGLLAAKEA